MLCSTPLSPYKTYEFIILELYFKIDFTQISKEEITTELQNTV